MNDRNKLIEKTIQKFATSLVKLSIKLKEGKISQETYDIRAEKIRQRQEALVQTEAYKEWFKTYDGLEKAIEEVQKGPER